MFGAALAGAARSLRVVAAATLIVPLGLFVGASWLSYDETRAQAEAQATRTLDLLHEHALKVLDSQRLIAFNVAEIIDDLDNERIRADSDRLRARMRNIIDRLPQVGDIWVIDDQGRPLLSARTDAMPANHNLADRPYFIAHRDRNERVHISEVFRGRLRNVEAFQYSERRTAADGAFLGVTAITIPPAYFTQLYAGLGPEGDYTAALIREDGAILARFPAIAGGAPRVDPGSTFMRMVHDAPAGGRYYTPRSGFDGAERVVLYRKLAGFPVYVVYGISVDAVRATWMRRMASHLVFGVPATAALFILALLAARRAARESETLRRLRIEVERRQIAEEGLRQTQKMEAMGHLTAGLAHDFNNLLTGIGGAIDLIELRASPPAPELTRLTGMARTGVERAATLTQRLLAFARQQPLQLEAVDVNRLVSAMSEMLRRTLGGQVRIETVLAGGLWPAKADAVQLESAILNLAINARDAMPDGGTLTIETANAHLDDAYATRHAEVSAGQYVMVAVTDTGTGMSADTMARATDPFFTTKRRGQGTGLGLSMIYGYIKQVGGHLKIYSEIGRGTVVKLYLPREAGAEPAEAPDAVTRNVANGDPARVVLVVEDDPIVREFSTSALRELGFTVLAAGDGPSALRTLVARLDIELLFTDIGLPGGMNGRQLALAALEKAPRLRVLYTTGYTANAIVHDGALDRGLDFISKPFSISALGAKIRSMGL